MIFGLSNWIRMALPLLDNNYATPISNAKITLNVEFFTLDGKFTKPE